MRLRLAAFVAGSDLRNQTSAEVQRRNEQLVESYSRVFALREQLANAEQLASVGQTAANVAHQVGTPLNLISGYVQLVKEEVGPDSPLLPRLALIEEQIAKVTATVRTLLDRSRQLWPARLHVDIPDRPAESPLSFAPACRSPDPAGSKSTRGPYRA